VGGISKGKADSACYFLITNFLGRFKNMDDKNSLVTNVGRPASIVQQIRTEWQLGSSSMYQALIHYRNMGELLLQEKAKLKHGEFKSWISDNFEFSYTTADRCMTLAKGWHVIESKNPTVRDLSDHAR
jgi:hypothetical protein